MSDVIKICIFIGISLVAVTAMFFIPPIPQDPLYHQFADNNSFLSIPNTLNVLTNLVFAGVGALGLYWLLLRKSLLVLNEIHSAYLLFFAGLILVAIGSGYYHWAPDNLTLIWDRLPMTIAFMAFFSILLAERISIPLARRLLPLLLTAGIASVVYWYYSEQIGQGDLRPYALIQLLPIVLTPLILLMFPSRFTRSADIWWFLVCYLIAKVFEQLDGQLFDWLVVISGHSLKHIAAGIGCLVFLRHLQCRRLISA